MQIKFHPNLRNREAELLRGHLFQSVSLIENKKVVGEEKSLIRFGEIGLTVQQGKEQGMIHHYDICIGDLLAGLLIKTGSGKSAALNGARVGFTTNLRPNPPRGHEIEITQGTVLGRPAARSPVAASSSDFKMMREHPHHPTSRSEDGSGTGNCV